MKFIYNSNQRITDKLLQLGSWSAGLYCETCSPWWISDEGPPASILLPINCRELRRRRRPRHDFVVPGTCMEQRVEWDFCIRGEWVKERRNGIPERRTLLALTLISRFR